MSPESPTERQIRLLRERRPLAIDEYERMLRMSASEFTDDDWRLSVGFNERAGILEAVLRRPNTGILDHIAIPCDPPFTSEEEMRSAIRNSDLDPEVSFLNLEIIRTVLEDVFPDDWDDDELNDMRRQWDETVARRKSIRERENLVADAAEEGSPSMANGAL